MNRHFLCRQQPPCWQRDGSLSDSPSSLKERVILFQKTGRGLEAIVQELSARIYLYPLKHRRSDEDDLGEFYLYFVPRLKRLLLRFEDQGVPFEHYFNATLYWNLKSFFRMMKKKQWMWDASGSPAFWEFDTHQSKSLDVGSVNWRTMFSHVWNGAPMDVTSRRRLLFLFLRHVRVVDDSEIDLFSQKTGYDRRWLEERISNLKDSLQNREIRLALLKKRRNVTYSRCLLWERELKGETDTAQRERLERQIRRSRLMLRKTEFEISRVPLSPSHSNIAVELGVPKGTVDTGIFWINKKLKALYAASRIDYA